MKRKSLAQSTTCRKRRWTYEWRSLCISITKSRLFTWFVIFTICLNALLMGLETDDHFANRGGVKLFCIFSIFFVMVYTIEFAMKFVVNPSGYWRNKYNIFDFVVLLLAHAHCIGEWICQYQTSHRSLMTLKVLRGLQTLTTLRMVSFRRALQVILITSRMIRET